jgi:hypothetical protein
MSRRAPCLSLLLALAALAGGCSDAPGTPEAAAAAIGERLGAGDTPGAEAVLREAIARWPVDRRLRELQGDLDLARGNGTLAQAAFERALRAAPGDRVLQLKLARSLVVQGRYREAAPLAAPAPGDTADVAAGFRLLGLEIELAQGGGDARAQRELAEELWRLAAAAPAAPGFAGLGARLEALAARNEVVQAGQAHARCRPGALVPKPAAAAGAGPVLRVGPGERFATPAAAAAAATDGAVVEIAPGEYAEAGVAWSADGLVLRGAGGRPRLRAAGAGAAAGATWALRGARTVVEGLEFDGGGTGIAALRLEAGSLAVRDVVVIGHAAAVSATDAAAGAELAVERSELTGGGIAAGAIARLVVEASSVRVPAGPAVVSRAAQTVVAFSHLAAGTGPLLAAPEGGALEVSGSELELGAGADGAPFVVAGAAGARLVSSTFWSAGMGRAVLRGAAGLVANNVYAGAPVLEPAPRPGDGGNVAVGAGLADPVGGDFGLVRGSPAIDAAVDAGGAAPALEFVRPAAVAERVTAWKPDAGAHEFCAPAGSLPGPGGLSGE